MSNRLSATAIIAPPGEFRSPGNDCSSVIGVSKALLLPPRPIAEPVRGGGRDWSATGTKVSTAEIVCCFVARSASRGLPFVGLGRRNRLLEEAETPPGANVKRPLRGSCQGLNLSSTPSAVRTDGNRPVRSHVEKPCRRSLSDRFIMPPAIHAVRTFEERKPTSQTAESATQGIGVSLVPLAVGIGRYKSGAAEKTRTSTGFRPQRPQRCASTSSATAARNTRRADPAAGRRAPLASASSLGKRRCEIQRAPVIGASAIIAGSRPRSSARAFRN